MTVATPRPAAGRQAAVAPAARRRHRAAPPAAGPTGRGAPWGWLPAGLTALGIAAMLSLYGVSVSELVRFAAYLLLTLALPGTLVWRALRGGAGTLVGDAAAGTVLGYAMEIPAYVVARAVGLPLLALAAPASIILAFLVMPQLRRHWRGTGQRAPLWWSWLIATTIAGVSAWSAVSFLRIHGLAEGVNGAPHVDQTFHLALAGELKHHMPPVMPYVQDEGLRYHWFVYADLAATSWGTGIELHTLLLRLATLPMVALLVIMIAILARTVTRRWWTGPAAVAIALLATAPSPSGWSDAPVIDGFLVGVLWLSPTQTFGAMLFVPAVTILVDLLRQQPDQPRAGRWMLLFLLLGAVTGAKATLLPILLGGLLVVIVLHAVTARGLHRPALIASGMTVVALAFAQFVLFGGSGGGLSVEPLRTVQQAGLAVRTQLTPGGGLQAGPTLVALATCLVGWACIWGGGWGLLADRAARRDPATRLLLGMGGAALGATLTFSHPGLSQLYFFISARPYLSVLAVAGLAAALPAADQRARTLWLIPPALLAGAGTVWALRVTGSPDPPTRATSGGTVQLAVALLWPYLVLLAVATAVGVGLYLLRHRFPAGGRAAVALALVDLVGVAGYGAKDRYLPAFDDALHQGWRDVAGPRQFVPAGALPAGRWLRDHSSPDDLVATNVHCRSGPTTPRCDNRNFWVAAYTERRVLVEGWGYTNGAYRHAASRGVGQAVVTFWLPDVLTDNDAVFNRPSRRTVDGLRTRYGVRWLLVDRRYLPTGSTTLDDVVAPRYRAGDTAVYELR